MVRGRRRRGRTSTGARGRSRRHAEDRPVRRRPVLGEKPRGRYGSRRSVPRTRPGGHHGLQGRPPAGRNDGRRYRVTGPSAGSSSFRIGDRELWDVSNAGSSQNPSGVVLEEAGRYRSRDETQGSRSEPGTPMDEFTRDDGRVPGPRKTGVHGLVPRGCCCRASGLHRVLSGGPPSPAGGRSRGAAPLPLPDR